MDATEVRALLRQRIAESGLTQAQWARANSCPTSTVSSVLTGAIQPRPAVLRALGLRRIGVQFEEVTE